jgi:hypothetical protein
MLPSIVSADGEGEAADEAVAEAAVAEAEEEPLIGREPQEGQEAAPAPVEYDESGMPRLPLPQIFAGAADGAVAGAADGASTSVQYGTSFVRTGRPGRRSWRADQDRAVRAAGPSAQGPSPRRDHDGRGAAGGGEGVRPRPGREPAAADKEDWLSAAVETNEHALSSQDHPTVLPPRRGSKQIHGRGFVAQPYRDWLLQRARLVGGSDGQPRAPQHGQQRREQQPDWPDTPRRTNSQADHYALDGHVVMPGLQTVGERNRDLIGGASSHRAMPPAIAAAERRARRIAATATATARTMAAQTKRAAADSERRARRTANLRSLPGVTAGAIAPW